MCDERTSVVFDGPIECEPVRYLARDRQRALLEASLSGLELGAWDRRIVAWLAGWDASTVVTVVSWLHRMRPPV